MYLATDIADGYANEVEHLLIANGLYNRNDKQAIKRIKDLTSGLIKSVDTVLSSDTESENFGDDSDFVKEVLELIFKTKTEQQKAEVIESLKLLIDN